MQVHLFIDAGIYCRSLTARCRRPEGTTTKLFPQSCMPMLGELLAKLPYWSHFEVTSASLLACEGDFGIDSRIWWWLCGNFGIILCSLLACEGGFGAFGRHFGVTLGALAAYGNAFGVALGSFWGQFGYLWVTLRHLMVTLQSLLSHFGYVKDRFRKTFISPTDFNDFIKPLGDFFLLKVVKIQIFSE